MCPYLKGSQQVLEIPIISEPELELSRSHLNRNKEYSKGSNRYIHEPVQTVIHIQYRQGLVKVSPNPPRSDELLANTQENPSGGGNGEIHQWMESTITQTSNKNNKGMAQQK
ncbi:hypothetical protein O181_003293 [Austropuccinia psidii MF-1]|uniref:Uncharacterized protein n=1 Tax=Austropuccinia psidii MF-1 TaxID=1389203 RepID=A0A9Q3BE68_9BASI|nr:hypothetical protein [Austropuccinia psidii MF-1]